MQEVTGTYTQFKQALDIELAKTAEGFVRIGYLLKVARDTEVLRESGYTSVAEFAKAEYDLSKDIVSRYIHINDKYSKGGYSEELENQYKGFGYSKLAEMLTLPDEIADALDPKMTRQQIQEVKKEVKQEQETTPLEVMTEGQRNGQQSLDNDLQIFLHQYGYENREKYIELAKAAGPEEIMDAVAPSGVEMLVVRIQGRGRLMLSIKGKDNDLELLDVRDASKNGKYTWQQLKEEIAKVYKEGTEKSWEEIYEEEFKKDEGGKQDDKERTNSGNNQSGVNKENVNTKDDTKDDTKTEKKSEQTKQDAGQISGRGGVEEPQIVKVNAVTEELKDYLFEEWFKCVSKEKIESACKMMAHMMFQDLINVTPKKAFLLVQTSQVSTEEIVENGQVYTKVSTIDCVGEFSSQDFQKRFNREYLEPYKKRMQELEEKKEEKQEVAPVQQEEQIQRQKHIDDVEYKEYAPDNDGYKTVALRVLPGEDVYCIVDYIEKEGRKNIEKERVEHGIVDHITIGSTMVPQIEVCNDENTWTTYDQAKDWGEIIFKTQEAAEKKLKEQQADEKC